MKYYAVKKGLTPGIYETWAECETNVKGVPGAEYKSFKSLDEAKAFIGEPVNNNITTVAEPVMIIDKSKPYSFVDGSFNAKTKTFGYGGFLINGKNRYILQGSGTETEMAEMRNVAGEIAGAVSAVIKAKDLGLTTLDIYYDYQGIESWVTGAWNCNKDATLAYRNFMQNCGIELTFHKVKGHSGIEGNEEADRLAKEAVGIKCSGKDVIL